MKIKVFVIMVFLTFLPAGINAYTVKGTVVNKTTNEPMSNYPVRINQYDGSQANVVAVDTTSSIGKFTFSGLEDGNDYGLSVFYQLIKYEDVRWSAPPPADHSFDIAVYDTTHSDVNVKIAMQHAVLTEGEGKLFVRQIMRVENQSDKAFIGTVPVSRNAYKSLSFQIPPGATNIRPGEGFMQCCVGLNGSEFYDTMELLPGSKDVVLYYDIPVESEKFIFQDRAAYPIDSYVALIKRQKTEVKSQLLNIMQSATDDSFIQLTATQLKRGQIIPIQFENFLQSPKNYGPYFIGLFVLILSGGIVLARKKQNQTMEEQNMPQDPVCHMPVPEEDTTYTTMHDGETYYFCCEMCQEAFVSEPEKYLSDEEGQA